jgi:hypothetical protein
MNARTHPFTRQELLEHARKVLAGHRSISNICPAGSAIAQSTANETATMEAIVAMLEAYPLASPAAECVRIIFDDLALRSGFREVITGMHAHDLRCVREYLVAKLASSVVFAEQGTPAESAGEELDFA